MKKVKYYPVLGTRLTNDSERAVLPTIIFAKQEAYPSYGIALCIGWWCWGIGFMRIVIKDDK